MDKYMRAAKRVGWCLESTGILSVAGKCAFSADQAAHIIREEIERPEPLEPGVRYRNTEANRKRLSSHQGIIFGDEGGPIVRLGCFDGKRFESSAGSFPVESQDWIMVIPYGEVRDE